MRPGKDLSFRKWATEGLAYLTLDAEVKEKLIEDRACIHAMIELARTGDESCLYGVMTTLMNLINAYEEQEVRLFGLVPFLHNLFSAIVCRSFLKW